LEEVGLVWAAEAGGWAAAVWGLVEEVAVGSEAGSEAAVSVAGLEAEGWEAADSEAVSEAAGLEASA